MDEAARAGDHAPGDSHGVTEDERLAARAFGELLLDVADDRTSAPFLRAAGVRLLALTGLRRCAIYALDAKTGHFRCRAGVPGRVERETWGRRIGGAADAFTKELLSTRRPVAVTDVRSDPRARSLATPRVWASSSILGVPVLDGDRVIAICVFDDEHHPHAFGAGLQEQAFAFCCLMGRWMTRMVHAAQLPEALRRLERERRSATVLAETEPGLSALARSPSSVLGVLRVAADALRREVLVFDGAEGPRHRCAPSAAAAGVRPTAIDAATVAVLHRVAARLPAGGAEAVDPSPGRGARRRWAIAPIVVAGAHRGMIAVPETARKLTGADIAIVRRSADVLGIVEERREPTERDPAGIRHLRRADRLGVVPRVPAPDAAADDGAALLLAVIRPGAGATVAAGAVAVEQGLASAGWANDAIALDTDGGVVLTVEDRESGNGTMWRDVLSAVAIEAGYAGATIGVVHTSAGETDLGPARAEAEAFARWAARHVTAAPGHVAVVTAEDLGPARLLVTPAEAVGRMVEEILGPVLDGRPGTRDLLDTLRCYFRQGRSTRAASAELGVHENTIRHRLGRILRATGRDVLTDADDQLMVHAALLALDRDDGPRTDAEDPGPVPPAGD